MCTKLHRRRRKMHSIIRIDAYFIKHAIAVVIVTYTRGTGSLEGRVRYYYYYYCRATTKPALQPPSRSSGFA